MYTSNNTSTFEEQQSIIIISGYIRLFVDLPNTIIVPQDIIKLCYLFYKFTKSILCFEGSSAYKCIEMESFNSIDLKCTEISTQNTTKAIKCMANEIQWRYPSIIYWDQLKYTSYSGIFEFNKAEGQTSIFLFESNEFQKLMHDKNTTEMEYFPIYLPKIPTHKCDECIFDKEHGVIIFNDGPQIHQLVETNTCLQWNQIHFKIENNAKWTSFSKMMMVEDTLFITNKRNSFLYDFTSKTWKLASRPKNHQRSFNVCYNYMKSRIYCIYDNCEVVIYEYINNFWRKHSNLAENDIGIKIKGNDLDFHYNQASHLWMNHDSDSILYYMDINIGSAKKHTVFYLDEREDKYRWRQHETFSNAVKVADIKDYQAVFT